MQLKRSVLAVVSAALLVAPPARVDAQILTGAIGAFAGTAAGGYITLSIVVARAQRGHYLHDARDLFGWTSIPVLAGGLTGGTLGVVDPDRLWTGTLLGAAGTAVGAGVGGILGAAISERPEGKWAGAAIGAGAGMTVGFLIGALWPQPRWIPREIRQLSVVPVTIRVPL